MRRFTPAFLKTLLCLIARVASAPAHALSCGATLYASVTLTADVVCGPGQYGLTIGDHKVRIELNGYSIVGPFSPGQTPVPVAAGIYSSGFDAVQIVGPGKIRGFDWPVQIFGGYNHQVSGVDARQDWSLPFSLHNTSGATIEKSAFTRLEIVSDPGKRATTNRVIDYVFGSGSKGGGGGSVRLRGCETSDNMVAGNFIDSYNSVALYIDGAHGNQLLDNEVRLGFAMILGGRDNVIAGNHFMNDPSVLAGVEVHSSTFMPCGSGVAEMNIVRGNQIESALYGVLIGDSGAVPATKNWVTANTIGGQGLAGLYFDRNAIRNDARGNNFTHVVPYAFDYGHGNLWP